MSSKGFISSSLKMWLTHLHAEVWVFILLSDWPRALVEVSPLLPGRFLLAERRFLLAAATWLLDRGGN